jgi:hypothetical protein
MVRNALKFRRDMQRWLFLAALALGACQIAPPKMPRSSDKAVVGELHFNPNTLMFENPANHDLFMLHLGEPLEWSTGGVTPVPWNIRGIRDATSSYWQPMMRGAACGFPAESLYCKGEEEIVHANTRIQFASDTGRILITEDKSDGRQGTRFILYTPHPNGGYIVSYLAAPLGTRDIRLEAGDRAQVGTRNVRVNVIAHSKHPFTIGD